MRLIVSPRYGTDILQESLSDEKTNGSSKDVWLVLAQQEEAEGSGGEKGRDPRVMVEMHARG